MMHLLIKISKGKKYFSKMFPFARNMQIYMLEEVKGVRLLGNGSFKNKNYFLFAWRRNNGSQNLKPILYL